MLLTRSTPHRLARFVAQASGGEEKASNRTRTRMPSVCSPHNTQWTRSEIFEFKSNFSHFRCSVRQKNFSCICCSCKLAAKWIRLAVGVRTSLIHYLDTQKKAKQARANKIHKILMQSLVEAEKRVLQGDTLISFHPIHWSLVNLKSFSRFYKNSSPFLSFILQIFFLQPPLDARESPCSLHFCFFLAFEKDKIKTL